MFATARKNISTGIIVADTAEVAMSVKIRKKNRFTKVNTEAVTEKPTGI